MRPRSCRTVVFRLTTISSLSSTLFSSGLYTRTDSTCRDSNDTMSQRECGVVRSNGVYTEATDHVVGANLLGAVQQLHRDLLAVTQPRDVAPHRAIVAEDAARLLAGLAADADAVRRVARCLPDAALQSADAAAVSTSTDSWTWVVHNDDDDDTD